MVEFLSDGWFEALGSVDVATDPDLSFRLDQAITGTPDGDLNYRVTLHAGRLKVDWHTGDGHAGDGHADDGPPDATLRLAYTTAVDLARGTRTTHDALLAGEVTFDGDPARVQALAGALGAIASALSDLRAQTRFNGS